MTGRQLAFWALVSVALWLILCVPAIGAAR